MTAKVEEQEYMSNYNSSTEISSRSAPTHCYLCGQPLCPPISKDHCPPKALFAPEMRKRYNPDQLITIPVHDNCNASYSLDEEYFVATMVPFAPGSEAGDAIFAKFEEDSRTKRGKRNLAESVLREFDTRPSGLYLPQGRVIKRQDGDSITRIAYKIARGLYFLHHNSILPEEYPFIGCTLTAPGEKPPEILQDAFALVEGQKHGEYPEIFEYLYCPYEWDNRKLSYWAFHIWDRIIITVYFHDPWFCQCEHCTSALAELKNRMGDLAT